MADWALADEGGRREKVGFTSSTSRGTDVTASASTNTKGSYAQLIASTAGDCEGFWLQTLVRGTTIADCLLDIAIGAASSEKVIVSNFLCCCGSQAHRDGLAYFPFPIPAATRIAARVQSTTGSTVMDVSVILTGPGFVYPGSPMQRVTTYGADTSDSGGAAVDPGGSANTKGSWTQIVASCDNSIRQLIVAVGNQKKTRSSGSAHFLVDVGIGGAGSEHVILPDLPVRSSTSVSTDLSRVNNPYFGPIPIEVPAGTRLSARAQCDNANLNAREIDVVLYGLG